MGQSTNYVPSERGNAFLSAVDNGKYNREITAGLQKFIDGNVPQDMLNFYTKEELEAITSLDGGDRDVQKRMPVKITRHYFEKAKNSPALQTLIKASPKETFDLDGSQYPGKQLSYSPLEGMIHKYELALLYVASTCSAHCRFCYREELIAKKGIEREDGTMAPKGWRKSEKPPPTSMRHNCAGRRKQRATSENRQGKTARNSDVRRRPAGPWQQAGRGLAFSSRGGQHGVQSGSARKKWPSFRSVRRSVSFNA